MIALDPVAFGLGLPGQRVLELGAGTGLLSLVWKGMCERKGVQAEVFATDYHDGVLENLRRNVISNSANISPLTSPTASPALHPMNGSSLPSISSASSLSLDAPASMSSSTSSLPVQALKLDWSAVHSSRAFSASLNPRSPVETSMPPPFDKPFHTLLAADVIYGPQHAVWLKSCVEQFLLKAGQDDPIAERKTLPREFADLNLGESSHPLPTRPSIASTDSSLPFTSHVVRPHPSSGPPTSVFQPAFHLIVPLRPTHAEAIATLKEVFPLEEDLPPRDKNAVGGGWRVATKSLTEVERVSGVGRHDEENYRLYTIAWC